MRSTFSTSSRVPMGRTAANGSVLASVDPRPDSRFTEMLHQPNGRHSNGWCTSIAWTRPGGTTSLIVVNSPNVNRTPSELGAIEYRKPRAIERT
ncbi:hypothetical protein SRABI128_02777 [Microbacterium sp. Bi128]|nr:hypothetical protein SRABI128_02777 [Microbacterium sp. Bi128]